MPDDLRTEDGDATHAAIAHAVGAELRRVRDNLGLTRADLVGRVPSAGSVQTLANYEYGIRQSTVARFVELCEALGVPATDVLGLALQRAGIGLYATKFYVDLARIAADNADNTAASVLREWARRRLAREPNRVVVCLEQPVVEELAVFLDVERDEFVRYLRTFLPEMSR